MPFEFVLRARIVIEDPDTDPAMDNALTLHFIDGSKLSLEFPEQTANPAARKMKLEDFMTSKHLVVEAEGSVLIFPVANIKYLSITTPMLNPRGKGAALPPHAIRGARIRS